MAHPSRACLNDIATAVPITAAQTVSIVSLVAHRLDRWITAKDPGLVVVPGIADITLHRGGHLWWYRGRSVTPHQLVPALGELLAGLLRAHPGRVPAGLLYIVARATDFRHLAPFNSLDQFKEALARYAPEDASRVLDGLLAYYFMRQSGQPPLDADATISDVRRLRRAGGVSLRTIAEDTGIPLSLLRELEWGVLSHWNPSHTARSLEAYAQRAGLDPSKVAGIVRSEFARQVTTDVAVAGSDVVAALVPTERRPAFIRRVPFAIAAALVGCVAFVTPADRPGVGVQFAHVAPAVLEEIRPASLVQPVDVEGERAGAPVQQPFSEDITAAPRKKRPRPVLPPKRAESRPKRTPTSAQAPAPADDSGGQVKRQSAPTTRLARVARVIAGDGRYRVEPFPRVQN